MASSMVTLFRGGVLLGMLLAISGSSRNCPQGLHYPVTNLDFSSLFNKNLKGPHNDDKSDTIKVIYDLFLRQHLTVCLVWSAKIDN